MQWTQMNADLWGFVSKFRDQTDNYNFTSQMAPYHGKFRIERRDLEEFWKRYCETVSAFPDQPCGLSQRPMEYQPVRVDIDLSRVIEPGEEGADLPCLYNIENVKAVILCFQKVFKEVCKERKSRNYSALLLEKSPYCSDGKIKNGFHLHFPKMWVRNCDHDLHIIPRAERYLNENYPDMFAHLKLSSTAEALDKKVSSKYWLLYGSCKSPTAGTYRFTKAFDVGANEISLQEALSDYKLFNAFEEEIPLPDEKTMVYNLPRILSTDPSPLGIRESPINVTNMKTSLECFIKQSIATARERTTHHENINVTEAVKIASELMPLISGTRADFYDDWLDMGWVLYNIGDGCHEALDLWISFSSKTSRDNFDEARCIFEWQKMVNTNRYTIGTLRHYASIDSPAEYEAWKKKSSGSRIKEVLKGGHNDLAKMLKDYYGSVFVFAPVDERQGFWYEYKNHRWHRNIKGLSLREKISDELVLRFQEEGKKIYDDMADGDPDDEAIQKKVKAINAILKNLRSAPFKNSVMQEAQEVFRKDDFLERLDTNIDLIGFTNGVFDCKTMTFREGKPEDYVSLCTGYDYKEFTNDSPEVAEVHDFMIRVFPDPLLRRYFLEYCALLLKGGNSRKTFLVMSGEGDNAKSITIELLEHVLGKGKYTIKFPTSLITGKRAASSAATPELARCHGVRFAVLQEPDAKDVINLGTLKELTGNDSFFARGLFKDGGEIVPMFKLGLICNKLPRLSCDDPASWNRILVLMFESWFPKDSSKVPKTFEEQIRRKIFPRDPHFSEKLPKMKQAMMWLMVQTLKEIIARGTMEVPAKVTEATAIYRRNNDVFLQYTTECMKEEEGASISLNEAYTAFAQWFKESFPNLKVPIKNEFRDDFCRRYGQPNSGMRWSGIRQRTIRDEVQEKKAVILTASDLCQPDDENEQEDKTPVMASPGRESKNDNKKESERSTEATSSIDFGKDEENPSDCDSEDDGKPKKRLLRFKIKSSLTNQ